MFNLIVAPQAVGALSDWFAGAGTADAASLRLAMLVLAPTGFWAVYHFYLATKTIVDDQIRAVGSHDQTLSLPTAAPVAVNP